MYISVLIVFKKRKLFVLLQNVRSYSLSYTKKLSLIKMSAQYIKILTIKFIIGDDQRMQIRGNESGYVNEGE